ncbi:Uncharacterized protein OS=Endozoicomonas elysicola GN=GV64_00235 PE=4 SV=1 [Gemmataceae bacterium]|nr:Uncharacterized protein OS=Endozoicomonas elysicola GN=GV64_00235 PE=4 SV=1 [Gemmataceae bacterium]VTU00631.1 Uncharacterized protein OS=Endozoicomonas elysicola GN=GV64_00235 PE=4 SV=1 [Gemmataceae bacterium]
MFARTAAALSAGLFALALAACDNKPPETKPEAAQAPPAQKNPKPEAKAPALEEADADTQKFFEARLNQLVKVKPKLVKDPAVAKVFSAKVYQVGLGFGSVTYPLQVSRNGDAIVALKDLSTNQDMPELKAIINPEFKLATETDAIVFEAATEALYPLSDGFDDGGAAVKQVRHKGTEWTFVRGKFFEKYKGFVVTTDEKGAITKVRYSLDISTK